MMMERDHGSNAIVGGPGEESSDYLLLGAIDHSWCPCDECRDDH